MNNEQGTETQSPADKQGRLEALVICVRHRDGWCATKRKPSMDYSDSIPTKCGHIVVYPWGIEKREPTCPECLEALGR